MAKLKTILPALRAEIDTALRAISLGMFTTDPFRMRSNEERTSQPIDQVTGGTPRLWQLDAPDMRKQITRGAPARKWEMVFPLRIIYPYNNAEWCDAAEDDIDRIYDYLTANPTAQAGVDIREPRFDEYPPDVAVNTETNWAVVTCPIWALIEIS
jgi:hypothetical protein